MTRLQFLKSALVGGASALSLAHPANAKLFDIPRGDLAAALDAYTQQAGVEIVYSDDVVRGHKTQGARGNLSEIAALTEILRGTGFTAQPMPTSAIGIVPEPRKAEPVRIAQAARRAAAPPLAPAQAGVETVVVTAQKKSENIQNVPIAVTALSQAQLTERQIAGGPDLVKEVPNLTFSKTNFTGYNLEIRGIGTQAISVTTDPAVAVAFNGTPFIRNHFFEQEFYDLSDVEVLRGPQGTLYGRNATAGVVDLKSALPIDSYEAMLSADLGNFSNRRLEGMLNLPIVGDKLDIRMAGEWTKRDGYTEDTTLDKPVDGRDLWSTRLTIGWKPTSDIQTEFVWEHFSEADNRLRSGKQLCKTDYGPGGSAATGYSIVAGVQKPFGFGLYGEPGDFFTQGCLPNVSLYSPQAYEAPLGYALPYVLGLRDLGLAHAMNPYGGVTQSTNLRDIESQIMPQYVAKNDTLEFNTTWSISPSLTFTSQTGYNRDFLWSAEDFNRFGANPGLFVVSPPNGIGPDPSGLAICNPLGGTGSCVGGTVPVGSPCATSADTNCVAAGYYCDPQVGCSDALVVEDLSTERAWQFSQEFRLSSNFSGPFNFTAGGNYLHYETVEKYYVFSNALTLINFDPYFPPPFGYAYNPANIDLSPTQGYVDPNPISHLTDEGHNYFLSQNPYVLNSYAVFGDANYDLAPNLKLIAGLRWTDDQKHFLDLPSWVAIQGYGYPVTDVIDQQWQRLTGRAVLNWTPQLDFTDQTLIYGSYAHGYKAGGANPPGAIFTAGFSGQHFNPVHPLTFKPEYIEAFELGTKNTLLNGALTLNGDVFYYNYSGYQISEIVDRTAINTNYNAHVEGAEIETNWEPAPGLKFGFAGGYENSGLAGGDQAVDLLDRTAGHPGWYVVKPFATEASNCIFPAYVAQWIVFGSPAIGAQSASYCSIAYTFHNDPFTTLPYTPNPTVSEGGSPCCTNTDGQVLTNYPGYDPLAGTPGDPYTGQNTANGIDYGPVPNNGAGFSKKLAGNQLPNAPHFTASLTAEYTMPVSDDWAATLHTDFYWQSQQWARVFEDPIDKIHGYSNLNVSLILTSADGWQVMGYVKNVFDKTTITGTFLNSDDTGLTTNVFITDPRLYGIRVTKHLDQGDGFWGSDWSGYELYNDLFGDADKGKPSLWLELGGAFNQLDDAQEPLVPPFFSLFAKPLTAPIAFQHPPHGSFDYDAKISFTPDDTDWIFSAAVRYGRASRYNHGHQQTNPGTYPIPTLGGYAHVTLKPRYFDAFNSSKESHEIFDFSVGKEVGLGMLGLSGTSELNGGLRFVQFNQSSSFSIHADPDYTFHFKGPKYNHNGFAQEQTKRSFHGIGPSLSWDASAPVADSTDTGGIGFDWGVNAAVLFGRQIARVQHQTIGSYHCKPLFNGGCQNGTVIGSGISKYNFSQYHRTPAPARRSRIVTVPNIGGFAGVSWRYQNAKVSFGYRADEFFGAMDGGIDTRKSENVGFFGPYANISIGLGG